jgi:VIT1/CCC1 family predicted Fe2+/Mn2+ transporter
MSRLRSALIGLATAYGASGTAYAALVRPRISRWGATDEETTKTLPGDELPAPYGDRRVSTRAIGLSYYVGVLVPSARIFLLEAAAPFFLIWIALSARANVRAEAAPVGPPST